MSVLFPVKVSTFVDLADLQFLSPLPAELFNRYIDSLSVLIQMVALLYLLDSDTDSNMYSNERRDQRCMDSELD